MVKRLWQRWRQDEGGWMSPEWALVVTLLVLGAITGSFLSRQSRVGLEEPAVRQVR